MTTTLTLVGLSINMIGTTIIFRFGYPQPPHEESYGIDLGPNTPLPQGGTVAQAKEKGEERKKAYDSRSKVGLGLMFLGFFLQFVAILCDKNTVM